MSPAATRLWAIALIVFGTLSLIYSGITYTSREKVLDLGAVEAHAERRRTIPLSPILGGAALVAGVVILGSRRSA